MTLHCSITGKYACDLDLFLQYRSFEDGLTFFESAMDLDLYEADHNPSFRVALRLLNYTIFDFQVYNKNHMD